MPLELAELKEKFTPKQSKSVVNPDRQLSMIRYTPDGKFLYAAGTDTTIRRWDTSAEPWKELAPLKGHNGWVQALAFAADSKKLFSVDSWGQVTCWQLTEADPKVLWSHKSGHDGWIHTLSLSPDGALLATAGNDQAIRVWNTADGKKQHEFTGQADPIFTLAWHPEQKMLLAGDLKGVVKQVEVATGKVVREFDAKTLYKLDRLQDVGGVRWLAFDKAGTSLVAGGTIPKNGATIQGLPTLLVFDWSSGKLLHTHSVGTAADCSIHEVHYHHEGFWMAVTSGTPGAGKLYFQRTGDEQPFFTVAVPNAHSLTLHPDGSRVVVSVTNASSNGNGRVLGKDGEYKGNFSPLVFFDMPKK